MLKTLRLTTSKPQGIFSLMTKEPKLLVEPTDKGELVLDKINGKGAYIHGDAETLAGFDIPYFIDGNLGQLDLPVEKQDILLLLPSGEHKCVANLSADATRYLLTLKK